MKTRQGFVSNSSSSSFVIALRPDSDVCPHCGRSDPNFMDIVEAIGARSDGCEQTEMHARGMEQLRNWVHRHVMEEKWETEENKLEWQKVLKVAEKAVAKGYEVAHIEVSYHDEATRDMFHDLLARKKLYLLWNSEGDINLNELDL
jgi:hypothetical protein